MYIYISVFHFILSSSNILLYGNTMFCLFIRQLMDVWVLSGFWLWWIRCCEGCRPGIGWACFQFSWASISEGTRWVWGSRGCAFSCPFVPFSVPWCCKTFILLFSVLLHIFFVCCCFQYPFPFFSGPHFYQLFKFIFLKITLKLLYCIPFLLSSFSLPISDNAWVKHAEFTYSKVSLMWNTIPGSGSTD